MRKQRNGAAAGDRSGPDEAKKRQQDERIVLESIYGDDLADAVPNAWKVFCFLSQTSKTQNLKLLLHQACSKHSEKREMHPSFGVPD